MIMSKYNCVIFDLDGTLMDTSIGVLKSVDYTIDKMNLKQLPENELRTFIGPPIQNSFRSKFNLNDDDTNKAAAMFRQAYKDKFLYDAEIFAGMIELLSHLKQNNILTMVATYKREDYTMMLLEHFGLSKYFDFIKGSDMEGKLTKADIVNLCIDRSGLDRDQIVLIGDTVHDAIGAKKAGIDFIAVTYGFGFRKGDIVDDSVGIFDSISDLQEQL